MMKNTIFNELLQKSDYETKTTAETGSPESEMVQFPQMAHYIT
jgi:hypothetical protein